MRVLWAYVRWICHICAMGRLQTLYGIDVPWWRREYVTDVLYANRLPTPCYGDKYMDSGVRGGTELAGMRVADENVPLVIC